MDVGFTGTQEMPTDEQLKALTGILIALRDHTNVTPILHHGDCIGSDKLAHIIAKKVGYDVILHPPSNRRKRAYVDIEECKEIREEKPYLHRNKDIVNESEILIAVPKEDREVVRSGTWSTFRHAKKMGIPRLMIYPDGSITNQAPALLKALGITL